MKKALITIAIIALIVPFYAGRADFNPPTPTAAVAVSSSRTTAPVALSATSVEFQVKTTKAWITAYSSTRDQTKSYGSPFITANGTHVHDGVIATNILPFGTQVKIPSLFGDKIFTVADRMAPKKKNVFDIWMYSREKALSFGTHYTEVVIVAANPISLASAFPATINL